MMSCNMENKPEGNKQEANHPGDDTKQTRRTGNEREVEHQGLQDGTPWEPSLTVGTAKRSQRPSIRRESLYGDIKRAHASRKRPLLRRVSDELHTR